ncbi:MAG: hypothetical protein M0Z59_10950 [Nitrospiraceae bacterium]|nr:hypothetical protein [Nitrospiraceae bacterium]
MGEEGIGIAAGSLLLYNLFDVAWEIDLHRIERRLAESKRLTIDRKHFSKAFEFANPPVSLALKPLEKNIGGALYRVNAYARVYDYGVLSIIFEVPLSGLALWQIERLSREIERTKPFGEDFKREVGLLANVLKDEITGLNIGRFEEDYAIYYVKKTAPSLNAEDFLKQYDLSSLLLYEEGGEQPGRNIAKELLYNSFSYSEGDLVVINWDNAFVLEPSGSMDIPDLIEYANAQLLELRVYDNMLDRELEAIYGRIAPKGTLPLWHIKKYEELAAKVMRTVTELTEITEKIDNSVKVTEDVYYARVYDTALRLFKVKQWEGSIRRKLDVASRVYQMLYQEIANKRTEFLEIVIVLLIALEIILALLRQ